MRVEVVRGVKRGRRRERRGRRMVGGVCDR